MVSALLLRRWRVFWGLWEPVFHWRNSFFVNKISIFSPLRGEKAARLRDEIQYLETLDKRGEIDIHAQPEVFHVDPKKGLVGLK